MSHVCIYTAGLDSFSAFSAILPIDAHTLRNAFTIGSPPNGPLAGVARLVYSWMGGKDDLDVLNDVRLGLDLNDAAFSIDVLAACGAFGEISHAWTSVDERG